MISAIKPTPAINPMSAPTSFGEALGRVGELPADPARRHHHLAQRVAGTDDAEKADEHGDPARLGRLRECGLDLLRQASREPGIFVDVVGVDDMRHEPGDADDEQRQRDEEQEQAEGDGAADDRSGDVAVALEDAQPEVDEGPVLVAPEPLVERRHRALHQTAVVVVPRRWAHGGTVPVASRHGRNLR